MPTKDFEQMIQFYYEVRLGQNQPSIWLPLVNVTLITQTGRVDLSLLFDTGASVTTLRADMYPLLGLQSWDQGQSVQTSTGGGVRIVYQYTATIEVFGKMITCPIHLNDQLPPNPIYVGVLGRDTVFNEFGFGFWERTHELYVTENP